MMNETQDLNVNSVVITRQYWSNIGLITERKIDPKHCMFIETPDTLTQNIVRVKEICLKIKSHQQISQLNEAPSKNSVKLNRRIINSLSKLFSRKH